MELPSGNCDGGFYCRTSSSLNNPIAADATEALKYDACPYGYYCPEGTSEPFPCPIGTYSSTSGLITDTQCTDCDAGQYCDEVGMTSPAGDCDAGFYCETKSFTARPNACTAGEKCPSGTGAAADCPAGYYQNNAQAHDCFPCP